MEPMEFIIEVPKKVRDLPLCPQWQHMKERLLAHQQHHAPDTQQHPTSDDSTEDIPGIRSRYSIKDLPRWHQPSFLLTIGGEEAERILKSCSFPLSLFLKFNMTLHALEDICLPRFLTIYNRYRFFTCKQAIGQKFPDFYQDLVRWCDNCAFGDLEEILLKDGIINGICEDSLRQNLLRTEGLDLSKTLTICQNTQESSSHSTSQAQPSRKDAWTDMSDCPFDTHNASCTSIHSVSSSLSHETKEVLSQPQLNMQLHDTVQTRDYRSHDSYSAKPGKPQFEFEVNQNLDNDPTLPTFQQLGDEQVGNIQPAVVNLDVMQSADGEENSLDKDFTLEVMKLLSRETTQQEVGQKSMDKVILGTNDGTQIETEVNSDLGNERLLDVEEELENREEIWRGNTDLGMSFTVVEVHGRHSAHSDGSMSPASTADSDINMSDEDMHSQEDEPITIWSVIGTSSQPAKDLACQANTKTPVMTNSIDAEIDCQPAEGISCQPLTGLISQQTEGTQSHLEKRNQAASSSKSNMPGREISVRFKHWKARGITAITYKCHHCPKTFSDVKSINSHMMLEHSVAKFFLCGVCGESFPNETDIAKHTNDHIQLEIKNSIFECTLCNAKFSSKRNMVAHLKKHAGLKPIECDVCGKLFGDRSKLKEHYRRHTGEKPYKCEFCGMAFAHHSAINRHIKQTHAGEIEKPYQLVGKQFQSKKCPQKFAENFIFKCTLCNAKYSDKRSMVTHLKKHAGFKLIKCDVCGNLFGDKFKLKEHQRTHTGEKPYKCELCGMAFAHSAAISKHKKTQHIGEQPVTVNQFQCKECLEYFVDNISLKKHISSHAKSNPFHAVCDVCGKLFRTNFKLKEHYRRHTGEKPYKCEFCGKAFAHHAAINKHRKAHRAENPFQCKECLETFVDNSSLKKHINSHIESNPLHAACDVCGKVFKDKSKLKEHYRRHTGEKPYKCEFCGKAFGHYTSLYVHRKTHQEVIEKQYEALEKPFQCKECLENFVDNSSLKKHINIHIESNPLLAACDVCGKLFKNKFKLKEHYRRHTGEKPYKCEFCGKAFAHHAAINKHRRTQHAGETEKPYQLEKPFQCKKCPEKFADHGSLKNHVKSHSVDKSLLATCDVCGKSFTQMYGLKQHYRIHTGEKPYTCEICGMVSSHSSAMNHHRKTHTRNKLQCKKCSEIFQDNSSLKKHINSHIESNPLLAICDLCGKSFKNKHHLRDHYRIHTGEKPYNCDICGLKSAYLSAIRKHMKTHHVGEKTYFSCNECPEVFEDNISLEKHVKSHTGENPFNATCDVCGNLFADKYKLKDHYRIHTGEKPFKCEICGMTSAYSSVISKHRRTQHTAENSYQSGEKPFKCDQCPERFVDNCSLKYHMRSHTGDKPLNTTCNVCGKSFGDKYKLKEHYRRHTGEKPYKCKTCGKAFAHSAALRKHNITIHQKRNLHQVQCKDLQTITLIEDTSTVQSNSK